jgi:predicted nuclease of restriction endonuclease-like (RecB) superfamily
MSSEKKIVQAPLALSSAPQSATPRPAGYADFLVEIKTQIRQRQLQAFRTVNSEMLALYWWLGENISQRQATLGRGKAVVENLARDLQTEFPGRNGFSAQNLWLMRQFVNEYTAKPKLQPLVAEISWSKNLLIMARCKDDLEREFCEFQNPKRRNLGSSHRRKEREREFRGLRLNFKMNKSMPISPLSDYVLTLRHWMIFVGRVSAA